MGFDWHQLWEICSAPDNIPIVALLFLIPFFCWMAFRQAFANDRLIAQLEADPQLAKTAHRKTYPWQVGLEQGSPHLAVPDAGGISGRHHCHHHSDSSGRSR